MFSSPISIALLSWRIPTCSILWTEAIEHSSNSYFNFQVPAGALPACWRSIVRSCCHAIPTKGTRWSPPTYHSSSSSYLEWHEMKFQQVILHFHSSSQSHLCGWTGRGWGRSKARVLPLGSQRCNQWPISFFLEPSTTEWCFIAS